MGKPSTDSFCHRLRWTGARFTEIVCVADVAVIARFLFLHFTPAPVQ
jgi:hypothetical protein